MNQVTQNRRDTGPGVPYINVANTDYVYDAVGQVRSIHDTDNASGNLAYATYTFDAAHRLTGINRDGTLSTYTYDNSDQVTADGVNTVTYDASGNRNNGSNTATTGNRLTTDGTWNYSYDDEGNQTKKVRISDGVTWTYGYDQANHLTHVERRTTDGGALELSADYKYDAWGNRIEKSVDDDGAGAGSVVVSRFAYDGWNPSKPSPVGTENFDVWADLDGSSSLTTRYIRGDNVDQLFARLTASDANRWYLVDHQGSVRNILDNGALSKDALSYDAFGNIVSESSSAERGRYTWTSRELDVETGLQYNRARYYDVTTGRWISQDPIGFDAGDSNLYRYVKNESAQLTDSSGMIARNLSVPEKTIVAIFLNSLNKLSQDELTTISDTTLFGVQADLDEDFSKLSFIDRTAATLASPLRKQYVGIILENGAVATVLPPAFAPPTKKVTWAIWNILPDGAFKNNKVLDVKAAAAVAHELQHAVQIIRAGKGGSTFLNQIIKDYTDNLVTRKMKEYAAYTSIPFEVEAFAVDASVATVLGNAANQAKFEKVANAYVANSAVNLIGMNADAKDLAASFTREYAIEFARRRDAAVLLGVPKARFTIPLL